MLTRTTGFMVALLAASVLIGALPCSRHCSGQAADLRSAPKETDPASAPQPAAAPADGSDDRRIGQLTNIQGVVVLRPPRASRWTPVAEGMPLKRGDWLRTDAEEANAVSLRLLRQTDLILGPGALVELIDARQIRIAAGDVRIAAAASSPVEVLGPQAERISISGERLFRVENQRLLPLEKEPPWLRGHEGKTARESTGSLLAKVDGRYVPLAVGYHKVSVDIRDQIARTTIEQSFVNQTPNALEGIFCFPLPPDAALADFGMWIGDRWVEADVVEKQWAHDIFETFLHRRLDPALLEWSGGNVFQARVFPIPGNSEKRITISYTQVLPLQGDAYRYQYALPGESFRQHPLQQLAIDVQVSSSLPLRSAGSPTHATRNTLTAHSAHLEFRAKDYLPAGDFEALIGVARRRPEVVLIPCRRGEEGYFMLQVAPSALAGMAPAEERPAALQGPLQREIVPDGEPLQLLIVADTSASMDAASRKAQAELVLAILASLGPSDRFNLAVCDVECPWLSGRALEADGENVRWARRFLATRASLGWTDLDCAMASALARCGPATHVIYIGDGIVTAGDADAAAFAKRLRRLAAGKINAVHAVAAGSSFDPGVLGAMASLGGGSMHRLTPGHGPRAVARELLREMTQPSLRDLKVEFRGFRTAAVYPEQLPNLPAGAQQIVLGRYLPEGQEQAGEVILTGAQGGQPLRLAAKISLKDAAAGNAFVPQLWARMHLDALLGRGSSRTVRDQVVALSHEYHIVTPYTSLLVLETDADRERFGVQHLLGVPEGERFFGRRRAEASWGLVEQQRKQSRAWRSDLRGEVLEQLRALSRGEEAFRAIADSGTVPLFEWWNGFGQPGAANMQQDDVADIDQSAAVEPPPIDPWMEAQDQRDRLDAGDQRRGVSPDGQAESGRVETPPPQRPSGPGVSPVSGDAENQSPLLAGLGLVDLNSEKRGLPPGGMGAGAGMGGFNGTLGPAFFWNQRAEAWPALFLELLPVAATPREPGPPWPAEARALARRLLRADVLGGVAGGLRIEIDERSCDARYGDVPSQAQAMVLLSPAAWLVRTKPDTKNLFFSAPCAFSPFPFASAVKGVEIDDDQTKITWCDGREIGALSKDLLLGTVRAVRPGDLRHLLGTGGGDMMQGASGEGPLSDSGDGTIQPLDRLYPRFLQIKPQDGGRTLLLLANDESSAQYHVLIDTVRSVVLSVEEWDRGTLVSTVTRGDFVQVAGAWLAGRIEKTDAKGRRLSLVTRKFTALAPGEMDRQWKQELADRDRAQLLRMPLPNLADARRAAAAGRATVEDEIVLLTDLQARKQWGRVLEHLEKAERLSGKPGMRWVRYNILQLCPDDERLKKCFCDEAARLARAGGDQAYLADSILGPASGVLKPGEALSLCDVLRPLFQRLPACRHGMKTWTQRRIECLVRADRGLEALRLRRQLAGEYPRDVQVQCDYVSALVERGQTEAVAAWLGRVLVPEADWEPEDEESLRSIFTAVLRSQRRDAELLDYLAAWIGRNPVVPRPYQDYLGLLVQTGHVEQAETLIARWLAEGRRQAGALPPDVAARLQAAVWVARGESGDPNAPIHWPVDRWSGPLIETVLALARCPLDDYSSSVPVSGARIADGIVNGWSGSSWIRPHAEEYYRLVATAARRLQDQSERLLPQEVWRLAQWIPFEDSPLGAEQWKKIAVVLRRRWDAAPGGDAKHALGWALESALARGDAGASIAFLREELRAAPGGSQSEYWESLFDTLLGAPWSEASESEALSLLDKVALSDEPAENLVCQIEALYRITDSMVRARFAARTKAVGHPAELVRGPRQARRREDLRLARQGLADSLRRAADQAGPALAPWMRVEAIDLDVLAQRKPDQVAEECWKQVGRPTEVRRAAGRPGLRPRREAMTLQQQIDAIRQERCLIALMRLAASNPKADLPNRVLSYLERCEAADPREPRWKRRQYQLLVALERPADLARKLRQWIDAGDAAAAWRLTLGRLLAEEGRLADAIHLFEAVRSAEGLRGDDCRLLADWYAATNQPKAAERVAAAAVEAEDETDQTDRLQNKLQALQQVAADDATPRDLDAEVLRDLLAALKKSRDPQEDLDQLAEFYQATHDFRLLAGLADAMLGRTALEIYPLVEGAGPLLAAVEDEATLNSFLERIAEVRRRARTEVDRRALDLLEALVHCRASELADEPAPHAERAVAALRRAWPHAWSPGEPPRMCALLASLSTIKDPPLAAEQLAEMERLYRALPRGSADRSAVAESLGETHWSYEHYDAAIEVLAAAVKERQEAGGGTPPPGEDNLLFKLVEYLKERQQWARAAMLAGDWLARTTDQEQIRRLAGQLSQLYADALQRNTGDAAGCGDLPFAALESILRDQIAHAAGRPPAKYLRRELYGLYCDAIRRNADVSLGRGETLYHAVEQKIRKELDVPRPDLGSEFGDFRDDLLVRLYAIYGAAHQRRYAAAASDLKRFIAEQLPKLLERQPAQRLHVISVTAGAVHDVVGPRDGMLFLIQQIENEPAGLPYTGQDTLSACADTLLQWRTEVRDHGDLEKRLLQIMLARFRRDLQSRSEAAMYPRNGPNALWQALQPETPLMAAAAEEVLQQNKDSEATVLYIAWCMFGRLDQRDRAIEILADGCRRGLLHEAALSQLITELMKLGPEANSQPETPSSPHRGKVAGKPSGPRALWIPIFEALVGRRPDDVRHVEWLMWAYSETGQEQKLLDLWKKTDACLSEHDGWDEDALASLGATCLACGLFEPAVRCFRDAIACHEWPRPHRDQPAAADNFAFGGGVAGGGPAGNGGNQADTELPAYYTSLARAYAGLGKTAEAVEAASKLGPGNGTDETSGFDNNLVRELIAAAPDLDAYADQFARQVEKTGLENPIVRKALGWAYVDKSQSAKAIPHLRIAAQCLPNDAETRGKLLACYDSAEREEEAVEELLRLCQLGARDTALYADLGHRYEELGELPEADRAYTSIVAVAPADAASHQALAEIRQEQKLWEDAAQQWEQVASLRPRDPTGLVLLAKAQIYGQHWAEAEATIKKLRETAWPGGGKNVLGEVRGLEQELKDRR